METQLPMFTWVEANRGRVGFGLQVFPQPDDPAPGARVLQAGRLAEELGFDAFFLGDHPAYAPECRVHLAVLASQTVRIRLGSVVNCALYRHPVMTARLATDVDHLSAGRLILGLGIGWNPDEFAQLGMAFPPVPERQEALEEAVAIIRGVWGPHPFTYHGQFFQTNEERITPPPLQRPGPPLLIAGAGERVTLRQVAQHADACNFGAGSATGGVRSPDDVRHKLNILRGHCEAVGRPFDDILRTHFTTWLILAEDEASAQAKLNRYYPEGVPANKRETRIVGTPDTVLSYFQTLADAGIQYFVVQSLDAGDEETFRLLAQEVAPRVKLAASPPA
ncbi:MAG: LLM class flavin-dependent oxidoreductase [Chloroflexota bacterium]|nr:LLM class flavin-dependent oxidoreductase [Chloroflexota bacterium]